MADIFLSYKKEDVADARRLVAAFEKAGFSVWWDDRITPQGSWDETIEEEISAAKAVVVVWTPLSVKSDWVRTEAHFASTKKVMVPILLRPCTIPLAFSLTQAVDLTKWDGSEDHRNWRKCLIWVRDLVQSHARRAGGSDTPAPGEQRVKLGQLAQTGEDILEGATIGPATPAGTVFADGDGLPPMRVIPAGRFQMGSPLSERDRRESEGPMHNVTLPDTLAFGVFPVTHAEWHRIAADRIDHQPAGGGEGRENTPVTDVTWYEANALADALSAISGSLYRLPSEAEWEYACRGGLVGAPFPSGADVDPQTACFGGDDGPCPVGTFEKNGFGLFDMAGNVREWCADLWHNNYSGAPGDSSAWTTGDGSMRVTRGGSSEDPAVLLRCASRTRATAQARSPSIGVRLVREL